MFREIKIRKGVLSDDAFARDSRICFRYGRFTLMESRTVEVEGEERQHVRCMDMERMCALDPGVRKFLTGYSPEGSGFILGCNTTKVLDKCIQRIDRTKKKYMDAIARTKTLKTKKSKKTAVGISENIPPSGEQSQKRDERPTLQGFQFSMSKLRHYSLSKLQRPCHYPGSIEQDS